MSAVTGLAYKRVAPRHGKIKRFLQYQNRQAPEYWSNIQNQRFWLDIVGKKNNVKTMDDWYNLTQPDVVPLGANVLVK
jgi:hypothetical protein